MKKTLVLFSPFFLLPFFSGCAKIGEKSTSTSIIYAVTAVFSLLLLAMYFITIKRKNAWFVVLFSSVFIVNSGYFLLSVSPDLSAALWANRLSYLGSGFLPLSMISIIFDVTNLKRNKLITYSLFAISLIVFLIAASPGFLDIYYKSVAFEKVGGVSVLRKEYGTWHAVYLFYLMGYFAIMIGTIIHAIAKQKLDSSAHAVILIVAVFVNICVWLLEQLVDIGFEFLSISYIISELFLIGVYLMIQHQEILIASLQAKPLSSASSKRSTASLDPKEFAENCKFFEEQLPYLTATERAIYDCYLDGKSTKEVLAEMNIAENTLKFHNKNIYAKLGVSSRKQLLEYASAISKKV